MDIVKLVAGVKFKRQSTFLPWEAVGSGAMRILMTEIDFCEIINQNGI